MHLREEKERFDKLIIVIIYCQNKNKMLQTYGRDIHITFGNALAVGIT